MYTYKGRTEQCALQPLTKVRASEDRADGLSNVKVAVLTDQLPHSVPEANYLPAHCANTFDLFDARWFDTTPGTEWLIRTPGCDDTEASRQRKQHLLVRLLAAERELRIARRLDSS